MSIKLHIPIQMFQIEAQNKDLYQNSNNKNRSPPNQTEVLAINFHFPAIYTSHQNSYSNHQNTYTSHTYKYTSINVHKQPSKYII